MPRQCFSFILLTLLTLISPLATSQSDPFANSSTSGDSFLTVDQAYQTDVSVINEQLTRIHWQITDGYYLYRHAFKVKINGDNITDAVTIPEGLAKQDEYFGDVNVYYQQAEIDITSQPASAYDLSVTYQGCADAGLCYPPETIHYRVDPSTGSVALADSSGGNTSAVTAIPVAPAIANDGNSSIFVIIIFALLGGMILNLMPCVLPVLSLKALAMNNQDIEHSRQQSWAYTAGVVISFVAIALLLIILRSLGEAIGWGFQLQTPWFVALLAYLFLFLGLAMAGYTELGSSLMGAGQSLTQGNSRQSSFFTGVLATVVASPCTAPFMGAATGYALTQSTPVAIIVFASLGLGMALPMLLISYIPSLHDKLPKPGAWMIRFKEFLAFPLYATALWLLWVVGRQTGIDGAITVLGGGILIAYALWAWRGKSKARVTAIVALLAAFYPLANNQLQPLSQQNSVADSEYQVFSESYLAELQQQGKPVFINFTADWCITCLANEKTALSTERVQGFFKQQGIVALKGDWTNYNPEITATLAKHGRGGVPLYLFYPADSQQPIILPQLLTADIIEDQIMDSL
ncbi:Thiol:disulfide interchange protein DsbD [Sinobacterium norvegicum]|uniref:Thiol:disulfide interchange protein DsbD n=1 Tax=Sinobacterium norvegicum TaxID=1641715 RepID=A0ABN8EJY4_9GAMM|nr:protein-disulfide reductase DsbD [Sinobacterium norvegicum]CAH0991455.1 Thiol:disulfide interchange protein DsbD [Sinobacterium norvegicum]